MSGHKKRLPKIRDPLLQAEVINIRTYQDFYARLVRLATSIFEWENLPDSMNGLYLEQVLAQEGQAALIYDENFGFINTHANAGASVNIYGRPLRLECWSYNYNTQRINYTGLGDVRTGNSKILGVLVENTKDRIPTIPTLELYAMRLAEAMRTEDVNIKQQKTPFFIPTDPKTELSIKNAYQQMDDNCPVIFGDVNNLGLSEWKAVKTEAPYVADKIQIYRQKIWNEALTYLGIQSYREKRERQVVDEVNASNEEVNLNLQAFLAPRQRAARYFNECFKNDLKAEVKVKVRSDLENLIKQNESVVADLYSNPGGDNE